MGGALGGVVTLGLGIFVAVLWLSGRGASTWAAITGGGASAPTGGGSPPPQSPYAGSPVGGGLYPSAAAQAADAAGMPTKNGGGFDSNLPSDTLSFAPTFFPSGAGQFFQGLASAGTAKAPPVGVS